MNHLHDLNEVIDNRYQIIDYLGRGGMGITYSALDLETSQKVALKCLSLKRVKDWKVLDLFKREAQVLSNIHHPAIPKYLNYFEIDTEQERAFYLVQELALGKSLYELVDQGWQPTQEQVFDIAKQGLDILKYLQSLIPPIIHRDIKPQNIVQDPNGRIMLVDFGAVRDTYHQSVTGGSTVIGTFGYMAPEQFRGQAVLSTDLYGLGATLLFLLTGKSPAELPQQQLKIDFQTTLKLPSHLSTWLEHLISPITETRFQSAVEALSVLRGEQPIPKVHWAKPVQRPSYSKVKLRQSNKRIVITIPPTLRDSSWSLFFGLIPIFIWGLGVITGHLIVDEMLKANGWFSDDRSTMWLVLLIIMGLPLLMLVLKLASRTLLCSGFLSTQVTFKRQSQADGVQKYSIDGVRRFGLRRFGPMNVHQIGSDLSVVEIGLVQKKISALKMGFSFLRIKTNFKPVRFGLFLTQSEKNWLLEELQTFFHSK